MEAAWKSWRKTGIPSLAESLRIIHARREKPKPIDELPSEEAMKDILDEKPIQRQAPRMSRAWKTNSISMYAAKAFGSRKPSGQELDFGGSYSEKKLTFGERRSVVISYMLAGVIIFVVYLSVGIAFGMTKMRSTSTDSHSSAFAYAGLAVSGLFVKNITQFNMQIFYQDPTSNSINYRISTDTISYSAAQQITLSGPPTNNVSLAAASFEGSDGATYHQILYIMDKEIQIANLTCTPSTPTTCSTLTDSILDTGTTNHVASDSSIAVTYLDQNETQVWRVFYHDTKYQLTQISFTNGAWDKEGTVIGNTAVRGSGLAATVFSALGYIEVLYVDDTSNGIWAVEDMNGQWVAPSPISSVKDISLAATSSLTISYASVPDRFFAFYTGADAHIYEYTAADVSSSFFSSASSSNSTGIDTLGWTNASAHSEMWMTSEGLKAPVDSTGWADQIRFFQMLNGSLVQNAFNTTSGVWDPPKRL